MRENIECTGTVFVFAKRSLRKFGRFVPCLNEAYLPLVVWDLGQVFGSMKSLHFFCLSAKTALHT